jgi:hypothetical protein
MALNVFIGTGADPEVYTSLPSTTDRYKVIKAAIDLALSFLETFDGTKSLKQVAQFIIEECKADTSTGSGLVYNRSVRDRGLSHHVHNFLRALRREFPPVYVTNTVTGEASTHRVHWGTNLDDWRPGTAGSIYLHQTLVHNMVYAREQSNIKDY